MTSTVQVEEQVWYTYHFDTAMDCPLGCGPGVHPLYGGRSCQPWVRVLQEARTEPWWGYQNGYQIHPGAYAAEAEADDAEYAWIRGNLPLGNRTHNLDNEHRWDFGPRQAPARRPVVVKRRRRARRRPMWRRLPLRRSRRRGKTMVRRVIEICLIGGVIWYVVHNPAGTANAVKTLLGGIGDFVTHLAT